MHWRAEEKVSAMPVHEGGAAIFPAASGTVGVGAQRRQQRPDPRFRGYSAPSGLFAPANRVQGNEQEDIDNGL